MITPPSAELLGTLPEILTRVHPNFKRGYFYLANLEWRREEAAGTAKTVTPGARRYLAFYLDPKNSAQFNIPTSSLNESITSGGIISGTNGADISTISPSLLLLSKEWYFVSSENPNTPVNQEASDPSQYPVVY